MALRLSDASSIPAPPDARPPDARIADRAQALLDARDVKGYRALFGDAAALDDPHRRYSARRKLMELGLGAAASLPNAAVPGLFSAIAKAGLDVLEEEPREPALLNMLGVSLYELGAIGPAESLFRAAKRLDPTLPHVTRNLEEIARRRGRGAAISSLLPRHLTAALPEMGRRAEQVAGRARPAEGLRLSLCMIVKDEEEMLPRSLGAVHSAVDEIIVVDTGSSDRSIEIARSFGATVIERPWTGSFAEPRNVSFDAASGDWIVYLDADEVLVEGDAERLRALTGRTWREAFYLVETNFTGDMEDGTAVTHNALRVFRNRPEYRFDGHVH